MTRFEVKDMMKKENEKSIYDLSDLKQTHHASGCSKKYPIGNVILEFQNFDGWRGNTCEHVIQLIPCLKEYVIPTIQIYV